MNLSSCSLFCALAFGLALVPQLSKAQYQLPDRALEKLENIVKLSPEQEKQALQIFTNLKDVMDSMTPEERPQKGAQSRRDALAAIRAILTPAQQAIYDETPQRLGGGSHGLDPRMQALNQKISLFVRHSLEASPEVAAKVGEIKKMNSNLQGATMTGPNSAQYDDPNLHPESGMNVAQVTGASGTAVFKVYWSMDDDGTLTLTKIETRSK